MTATFSDIYFRPTTFQDDSARMRAQLAATYVKHVHPQYRQLVRDYIQAHSGIVPKSSIISYPPLDVHFNNGKLRDVLDSITAISDWLNEKFSAEVRNAWLKAVQNIFDKQHIKYVVDAHGTVRLRVDAVFEVEREAALAGLKISRYSGVRAEFEAAYEALSASNPDGKSAVRGIFEACEISFKLMFPNARRIGAQEIGNNLMPFIERYYENDTPAQEASKKLVQSFADWVASAQFYRHGQGQEDANQPPVETAVIILASGAAHLRWLIHLDQATLTA